MRRAAIALAGFVVVSAAVSACAGGGNGGSAPGTAAPATATTARPQTTGVIASTDPRSAQINDIVAEARPHLHLPVELTDSSVLPTGVVTLAGSVPDGAGTRGVVVRLAATGLLDTGFSTDGVVDVAGTRGVHAIDDRNGRVTVGGSSSMIDSGTGAAPLVVQVLFG